MAAEDVISQVIRVNYVQLEEKLDCTVLLGHLYSKKVISQSEKEHVEACVTRRNKSRELLYIISTKGDIALDHILEFLYHDGTLMDLFKLLKGSATQLGYQWQLPAIEKIKITSNQVLKTKWWPRRKEMITSFVNRKSPDGKLLIEAVRDQLHSGESRTMAIIPQALTLIGMGGVGKTSLAKWYADTYEDDYDQIIWIDSEGQSLVKSFRLLAGTLQIKLEHAGGEQKRVEQLAEEVYERLDGATCLYIFDNEDEGYSKVGTVLPKNDAHYVLITSRIQGEWGQPGIFGSIPIFRVDVFTEEGCLSLVAKWLEISKWGGPHPSRDEILEVGRLLGYLPLALQCAISTIICARPRFTFASYLQRLKDDMSILIDERIPGDYANPLNVALKLSMEQIMNDSSSQELHRELCRVIMCLAAYCHSDNLPEENFVHLLPGVTRYQVDDAVEDLVRHSLLSRETGKKQDILNIHRLLQQVLRNELKTQNQDKVILKKALELLNDELRKKNINNAILKHGISVWNYAAEHEELFKEFIEFPEGIITTSWLLNSFTTLHYAAQQGHIKVVKYLVEKGADVNYNGMYGGTPMHIAIKSGKMEVVKYLVEKGGNVNAKSTYDGTSLHMAVESGKLEIVKYLVEKGADVNPNNIFGSTPTHIAIKSGNLELVKYLVEKGGNVNPQSNYGGTPLHRASETGKLEVVKYLVEKGANVTPSGMYSGAPMQIAIKSGNLELVKYLVEKGGNVNPQSNYEGTPLHTAAETGNLELLKYLVEKGANVNSQSNYEGTPLHRAAKSGKLEVVKYLVEKGANVTPNGMYSGAPMHIAIKSGNLEVVKYLVEKGGNVNPQGKFDGTSLHTAAKSGNLEVVKYLVEKRANVNVQSKLEGTPLHRAAESGNLEVVKYLVEKGANVNAQSKLKGTPLHTAAESGNLEAVKYLAEKGANVDAQSNYEGTPLHRAAKSGNLEVVKYLVEKVEDVNP